MTSNDDEQRKKSLTSPSPPPPTPTNQRRWSAGMKRDHSLTIHSEEEGEDEESDDEDEEEEEEEEEPPPKKARLSEEDGMATQKQSDVLASATQKEIKKEPKEEVKEDEEEEQQQQKQIDAPTSKNSRTEQEKQTDDDGEEEEEQQEYKPDLRSSPSRSATSTPSTAEVTTTSTYPEHQPVPTAASVQQCSCAAIRSHTIGVPGELAAFFMQADQNEAFLPLQESVPNILVEYDHVERRLVVKSFCASAIDKVRMLADAFIDISRQRQKRLRNREENRRWGFPSFESNLYNANFLVEIEVSRAYMGLAIGRNGANLSLARALPGIRDISLDESQRAQGICKFKIYADSSDVAEQARKMLEYTDQRMTVPTKDNTVGRLIGRGGYNFQDIVNKSGIVRILVGDKDFEKGTQELTIIGTPETIANAELMFQFHLRHLREWNDFDEESNELSQEWRQAQAEACVDAAAVSACRKFDNSAFDHWTAGATATEGAATAASTSRTTASNNRRPPRRIGRGGEQRALRTTPGVPSAYYYGGRGGYSGGGYGEYGTSSRKSEYY